jgi:hypothetical protein
MLLTPEPQGASRGAIHAPAETSGSKRGRAASVRVSQARLRPGSAAPVRPAPGTSASNVTGSCVRCRGPPLRGQTVGQLSSPMAVTTTPNGVAPAGSAVGEDGSSVS